ncbi:hypothetical protein KUTeg_004150 [Tegillarca granosa]|uniref:Uncharacterized protein n=1 Tax=Tegillarca granosa TaxID=220873 RepID=A0ABQ9FP54_TEGGR|nr:hypothetical protein KUTeg_004150 [Tegillarca granosa]
MGILIIILTLVICLHQTELSQAQSANDTSLYLDRTLNALTNALLFYDREHRYVNLDAVGWMRMVEDIEKINRIRSIVDVAGIVSDKAIPHVRQNTPRYYQGFRVMLNQGFWEINYSSRDIPSSFRIFPYRADEGIDGSTSDNCIVELLGTGSGRPPCDITPSCWVSMTTPGYFGYSLSHQIYWLEIAELNGCASQMETLRQQYGQPSIPDIQTGLCANILAETQAHSKCWVPNAQKGSIHGRLTKRSRNVSRNPREHLLSIYMYMYFMIAFCGKVGFREFFQQEALDRILSWQDSTHGCYMELPSQPVGALRRQKRAEVQLRHGCLAHLTGVAIGALAQYVRYILEMMSISNETSLVLFETTCAEVPLALEMKLVGILNVFVYCVLCVFSVSNAQFFNGTRLYLHRTLDALMGALLFYDREHMFVNLDALSWTRMIEGQLTVLLRRIASNPQNWNVDPNTLERIRQIITVSGIVSDKARPYIARRSPIYHQIIIYPYRRGEAIGGGTSDGCIGHLIGTVGPSQCNVTPFCWRSMTSPGYFGYSLSHELWWLQIGELNGCSAQMERMRQLHGSPPIPRIQEGLCANMLAESILIANNGFPYQRRDLFMEDRIGSLVRKKRAERQLRHGCLSHLTGVAIGALAQYVPTFCGILGFGQFFRLKWLEHILSWQNPQSGCYDKKSARRKRSERLLNNGCLAHLTAMAITCLSQYSTKHGFCQK